MNPMVRLPGGLCIESTITYHMGLSQQTGFHAHLAQGGHITPIIVTKPEAQLTHIPEDALQSPIAGFS